MKTRGYTRKLLWRGALAVILAVSMLVSASVMCFAQTTASDEANENETVGITGVNISLSESIVVKFHTTAITDDGSKLKVTFRGDTYEISENENGVFSFVYVTPQYMGEELVATMYDAKGAKVGEEKKLSVKSNLEDLLKLSYEESGCGSELQYQAMRELCVNILNYGAAAQTYFNCNVDNIVNAGLSDEQKALATDKITVTDTDKAVNGAAWVGAGVRFDYKLGLYFVFEAASANEYTATINGTEVTPEAYEALGESYYVIRYNSFNATNMNDVVTAKLTKDGADDQTFAYSIKSYVASKGGDDSAIANLVNATYVYGFAAVAYSAEYVTVDPTFEEAGSISMDDKGYDFSQSKYGTVTLPKLDFENYTVETVNSGTDTAPVVTTSFKWNDTRVDYTCDLKSNDYINIDNVIYSQYDFTQQTNEGLTIEYNAQSGYTVTGDNASVSNLAVGGTDLTIKGKISTTDALTSYATSLIIDGTLYVGGDNSYKAIYATDTTTNGYIADINSEYGFKPAIYIREGTLKCSYMATNSLQVGSEKYSKNGTLIMKRTSTPLINYYGTDSNDNYCAIRYVFAKGSLDFTGTKKDTTVINARTKHADGGYVYFGDGIEINLHGNASNNNILRVVGGFQNGTCYYDLYMGKNATLNYDGTLSYGFATYRNASGRVDQYSYTTATVSINGEDKLVRLASADLNITDNNGTEVNFHYSDLIEACPDASTIEGKTITLSTDDADKVTYGIMGEFTQITHIDGVAVDADTPIYCQVLDWKVVQ